MTGNTEYMITVDDALERVLNIIPVMGYEEKTLLDCLGQVAFEDIYSDVNVPQADNSTMDGYALQAGSTAGATTEKPVVLQVTGELAAGEVPAVKVEPGTAIRIMTGAVFPDGADAIVPFELTDEESRTPSASNISEIGILTEIETGANVRRSGEDITRGERVIVEGRVLQPADIGLIASVGKDKIKVVKRPVVGVLATGNELVDVGQPLMPGKIYNSNAYSLAAQVKRYGGIPRVIGIARDNIEDLCRAIDSALQYDLLITSGGVSMGDYDIVKDVLAQKGDIEFWAIRMKPGKPVAFGTLTGPGGRKIPHLGLPGNPVSSMVTFEVIARPAILKMMGKTRLEKYTIKAELQDTIKNNDSRRIYSRAVVSKTDRGYCAALTGPQGSGILRSMGMANGLVVIPESQKIAEPGSMVDVMMLYWDDALDILTD